MGRKRLRWRVQPDILHPLIPCMLSRASHWFHWLGGLPASQCMQSMHHASARTLLTNAPSSTLYMAALPVPLQAHSSGPRSLGTTARLCARSWVPLALTNSWHLRAFVFDVWSPHAGDIRQKGARANEMQYIFLNYLPLCASSSQIPLRLEAKRLLPSKRQAALTGPSSAGLYS